MTYTIEGDVTVFVGPSSNNRRAYFERMRENLIKIFNIDKYTAEGYIITFILDINPDFGYVHFRAHEAPKPLGMPEGRIFYMDFVYGDVDNHGDRIVAGVDPANDDMIDAMMYAIRQDAYGELDHPAEAPIIEAVGRVARQVTNLDLPEINPYFED